MISAVRLKGEMKFLVHAPVLFKNSYVGEVLAWVSTEQVYHYFIEGNSEKISPQPKKTTPDRIAKA